MNRGECCVQRGGEFGSHAFPGVFQLNDERFQCERRRHRCHLTNFIFGGERSLLRLTLFVCSSWFTHSCKKSTCRYLNQVVALKMDKLLKLNRRQTPCLSTTSFTQKSWRLERSSKVHWSAHSQWCNFWSSMANGLRQNTIFRRKCMFLDPLFIRL